MAASNSTEKKLSSRNGIKFEVAYEIKQKKVYFMHIRKRNEIYTEKKPMRK